MKRVWVVLRSDPARSHRCAEGFRVALGLQAGPLEVRVAVAREAAACLGEEAWNLEEGDALEQNRDRFLASGGACWVEAADGGSPDGLPEGVEAVSLERLAAALAGCDRVLVF